MGKTNQSSVTEFVLLGLSGYPELEAIYFVLVLFMYLVILLGNGVIIIVSVCDSHLHTPMYFFLSNLSFLDICYTSSSIPLFLSSFLTTKKTISFSGPVAHSPALQEMASVNPLEPWALGRWELLTGLHFSYNPSHDNISGNH